MGAVRCLLRRPSVHSDTLATRLPALYIGCGYQSTSGTGYDCMGEFALVALAAESPIDYQVSSSVRRIESN